MNITIKPWKPGDGGLICLPLRSNIPDASKHPDWRLVTCPSCGQIEIAEYDGQIRGQMSFNDLQTQEQPAEPDQATAPAANETQPAAGAAEQQPAPTGKPLDLKNRNKKPAEAPAVQEPEKAEAAAGELVPGRDFDPETGEVFENGRPPVDQPTTTEQPKSNQHKVITMGPKAVNA